MKEKCLLKMAIWHIAVILIKSYKTKIMKICFQMNMLFYVHEFTCESGLFFYLYLSPRC